MRQDTNMSAKAVFLISVLTILLSISVIYAEEENESGTKNEAEPVVTEELTEYKKGSVCGYCKYCEVKNPSRFKVDLVSHSLVVMHECTVIYDHICQLGIGSLNHN